MEVLAVNGSPKGRMSCTHLMLEHLLQGMKNVGAHTEEIFLNEYTLHHCTGCFSCWWQTPGKCVLEDDMNLLLPKIQKADWLIYGSPLHYFSMTSLLKIFIERQLPLAFPYLLEMAIEGSNSNALPKKKFVWVSPCGFPDSSYFAPLRMTMKKIAQDSHFDYVDEIIRPTAERMFSKDEEHQKKLQTFYHSLEKAGQTFLTDGKISTSIKRILEAPWMTEEEFTESFKNSFLPIPEG